MCYQRFFSCFCCRRSRRSKASNVKSQSIDSSPTGNSSPDTQRFQNMPQPQQLTDLVENPYKIDIKLERGIIEWEEAINEYKVLEKNTLEDVTAGNELRKILQFLREDPESFIHFESESSGDKIRKLAAMKVQVNATQLQLGLASNNGGKNASNSEVGIPGKEDSTENPMHGSLNDIFTGNSVSSALTTISSNLSTIWANRLNSINPTQGRLEIQKKMSITSASSSFSETLHTPRNNAMKIKPKWPDFLIDTSFDVIKINKMGQKMRRTLKLTQHHVISIKNGCEITKFYALTEIRLVWLENQDTVRIIQRSNKMNVYMSPISPHILQQITTRVKVRTALDKVEISDSPLTNLGYSPDVISGIIKSISEDNSNEAEQVVAMFANDLRERTVRALSVDDRMGSFSSKMRPSVDFSPVDKDEIAGNQLKGNHKPSFSASQDTSAEAVANFEPTSIDEEIEPESSELFLHQDSDNQVELYLEDTASRESRFHEDDKSEAKEVDETETLNPISNTTTTLSLTSNELLAAPSSSSSSSSSSSLSVPTVPVVVDESTSAELQSLYNHLPQKPLSPVTSSSSSSSSSNINNNNNNNNNSTNNNNVSPKFISFKEGMPEHTIQVTVRNLIFDETSPEGNTRKVFVESFAHSTSSQKLLDVRHFIDGMHSHIVEHRGAALCLLYEQERQSFLINSPKYSEMGNVDFLKMLDVKSKSKNSAHKITTKRGSFAYMKDSVSLLDINESILAFVSFIVFMVVEESMFLPLKEEVYRLLPSFCNESEEKLLVDKMKIFRLRTQAQWGVPLDLVSPLGWQSAVFELAGVELNLTPSTQLHILTRTIKAIYSEFKLVVLPRLQSKGQYEVYIGADDLVPIFMFVFCQSDLRHPIKNRELMWALCHPDLLQGEAGYYLTIYESSIEFILSESITSASFASPSARNSTAVNSTTTGSINYSSPSSPAAVVDISSLRAVDNTRTSKTTDDINNNNNNNNNRSRNNSNAYGRKETRSKSFQQIIMEKITRKTLTPSAMSKLQNASMRESFNSDLSS